MNARQLLLIAALLPAGLMMTSCSLSERQIATTTTGLGPKYNFRATEYTLHSATPGNQVNVVQRGYPDVFEFSPIPGTSQVQSTLHHHPGTLRYETAVSGGRQYSHSHLGHYPHEHPLTPDPIYTH